VCYNIYEMAVRRELHQSSKPVEGIRGYPRLTLDGMLHLVIVGMEDEI
jgi:hypothetical protein